MPVMRTKNEPQGSFRSQLFAQRPANANQVHHQQLLIQRKIALDCNYWKECYWCRGFLFLFPKTSVTALPTTCNGVSLFLQLLSRAVRQTSNGCLRLEHGSNRHETLPKCISDNSRHFVFQRQQSLFDQNFGPEISFFVDLDWFWRTHGQTDLKISFLVKFCSRQTSPEVCATKYRQKYDCCARADVAPIQVSGWRRSKNCWILSLIHI